MRIPPFSSRAWSLVALAMLVTVAAQARNLSLPEAKPESVGFSSERLKRLDAGMKAVVDNKQLAGIATVVAHRGQVVQQMTYGQAAAAVPAGRRLGVQRRRRYSGLPGGEAVGQAVPRIPARAHLRAVEHERHGVLRAGEQDGAARHDLSVGQRRS